MVRLLAVPPGLFFSVRATTVVIARIDPVDSEATTSRFPIDSREFRRAAVSSRSQRTFQNEMPFKSETLAFVKTTRIHTSCDAADWPGLASTSPPFARASSGLPVPGGRHQHAFRRASSEPWYFPGSRRKSTTSLISASTSSIPATSSKVTRTVSGSTRLCLPPPRIPPTAACWCRSMKRDNQQDGRHRNQQVRQEPAMFDDWRRSNSRFSLRQLRQLIIVRKRRALRCELLAGAIRLTRQGRGFLQSALDRVPRRSTGWKPGRVGGVLPSRAWLRHDRLELPRALFMSAGGYHYHLAANVWSSGPAASAHEARMLECKLWSRLRPTSTRSESA